MRYIIGLLFSLFMITASAQKVTEIHFPFYKKYNEFWSGKKANLVIELHKVYSMDEKMDTTYEVYLKAYRMEFEAVAINTGISIGSLWSSAYGGKTENIVKKKSEMYMTRDDVDTFLKRTTKVYKAIKNMTIFKAAQDRMVVYEDTDIKIGGTYSPSNTIGTSNYYIQMNDVLFNMTEEEFMDVSKELLKIINGWNEMVPKPKA